MTSQPAADQPTLNDGLTDGKNGVSWGAGGLTIAKKTTYYPFCYYMHGIVIER